MARPLRHFSKRKDGSVVEFKQFDGPIWGICVHTTGRGLPTLAMRRKQTPMATALDYYGDPSNPCPHYVIDGVGTVEQIANSHSVVPHVGVSAKERSEMLSGDWTAHVSDEALERWQDKWKPHRSPQHLFPSRSANGSYLGIELIPQLQTDPNGELFTAPQYAALAIFIERLAEIHKIDTKDPRRLLGHEDLDPFGRWDSKGGWDPGALRERPYFRWDRVRP